MKNLWKTRQKKATMPNATSHRRKRRMKPEEREKNFRKSEHIFFVRTRWCVKWKLPIEYLLERGVKTCLLIYYKRWTGTNMSAIFFIQISRRFAQVHHKRALYLKFYLIEVFEKWKKRKNFLRFWTVSREPKWNFGKSKLLTREEDERIFENIPLTLHKWTHWQILVSPGILKGTVIFKLLFTIFSEVCERRVF